MLPNKLPVVAGLAPNRPPLTGWPDAEVVKEEEVGAPNRDVPTGLFCC